MFGRVGKTKTKKKKKDFHILSESIYLSISLSLLREIDVSQKQQHREESVIVEYRKLNNFLY